jgi:hypothetical protein
VSVRPSSGYGFGYRGGSGGWYGGGYRPVVSVNLAPGWGSGRWFHGSHSGRLGWWWGVNNSWYLYDAPVYPYPAVTSTVVVPVQRSVAYFCRSAWAYYPQVSECAEGWESVPR